MPRIPANIKLSGIHHLYNASTGLLGNNFGTLAHLEVRQR